MIRFVSRRKWQPASMIRTIIIIIFVAFAINSGQSVPSTMQAIIVHSFGGPEALQLEEISVPTIANNQVLIKVKAAGLNPVDVYMREGSYMIKPELPAILGKEISGIVEKVGSCVSTLQLGDRVFCGVYLGGYAEYAAAYEHDCYPLSKTLTFSQGASLYVTYFCAVRGILDKGNLERGHTILIQGASGSFGTAAVEIAKDVGATVVASVRHHGVEKIMRQSGADYVVYHDAENYLTSALQQINRTGFDVILEILGRVDLERDKSVLNRHGRIVVVGNRAPVTTYEQSMMTGQPIVYTVSFFKYRPSEQEAASEFVLNGIRHGTINPRVGYRYKLTDAFKAHTDLAYNPAENGKPVFVLE